MPDPIVVRDLVKTFTRRGQPEVRAVDGLTFAVRRGSIFALLGPNGAGKTTTLKMLTTLLRPTSGEISVEGFDPVKEALEVRKRISVVIQESAADLFLSVIEVSGASLVFGVGMTQAMGMKPLAIGVDYNAFFLAGVLGMASFGIASNTAWSFFMDRDNGIFFEMLTYPMRRAEYLLGKGLFNLLVSIAQGVVTVYFILLFASSMFYPVEPLPTPLRQLSWANPITWHVDVLRYATIGIGQASIIWLEAGAFLMFTAAAFGGALWALKRQ